MTFSEFIEAVENDEIECPGLKHCSLEHRRALRVAFNAGADCIFDLMQPGFNDPEPDGVSGD